MRGANGMGNRAPADHAIADAIAERWSPRAFADRPVPADDLRALFEAARWAPSSANAQPWSFIVATRDDAEAHERLAAVLNDRNRRWAAAAPVLALSVARLHDGEKPNPYASYDTGQAVGLLLVQATTLGLAVHQMAGYSREAARAAFSIPDDHEPRAAMAIGHIGEPAALPEDLRVREARARVRRPLREFVFGGRFGHTAGFIEG